MLRTTSLPVRNTLLPNIPRGFSSEMTQDLRASVNTRPTGLCMLESHAFAGLNAFFLKINLIWINLFTVSTFHCFVISLEISQFHQKQREESLTVQCWYDWNTNPTQRTLTIELLHLSSFASMAANWVATFSSLPLKSRSNFSAIFNLSFLASASWSVILVSSSWP